MWPDSSSLKHLISLTKIDFPPVHRILCTSFLTLVKNQDSINKANYHEFFDFHPYNSGKTITYLINFLTNTFPSTEEVCYFTASPTMSVAKNGNIVPERVLIVSGVYFGSAFATPLLPPHTEIFDIVALNGKPASFTKLAGYLHWEVGFSGTELASIWKQKWLLREFLNYLPFSTGWFS